MYFFMPGFFCSLMFSLFPWKSLSIPHFSHFALGRQFWLFSDFVITSCISLYAPVYISYGAHACVHFVGIQALHKWIRIYIVSVDLLSDVFK